MLKVPGNDPPTGLLATATRPVSRVHELLPSAPRDSVALTIDDGPDPLWTPQILDLLHRADIRATFCLVGMHAQVYPGLVKRIIAEGHSVVNHSMSHPQPFGNGRPPLIRQQIADAQSAIADAGGVAPSLFRAPCGDWSARVRFAARSRQLGLLGWSIEALDWSRPDPRQITARLLLARAGDILLCHDGGGDRSETVESLRTVLPALEDRGLEFVTL